MQSLYACHNHMVAKTRKKTVNAYSFHFGMSNPFAVGIWIYFAFIWLSGADIADKIQKLRKISRNNIILMMLRQLHTLMYAIVVKKVVLNLPQVPRISNAYPVSVFFSSYLSTRTLSLHELHSCWICVIGVSVCVCVWDFS